jgi:ferritin-like metal-binding protein YciE
MKLETVQDLFQRGLEYTYDCEQQLIKALPKLAEASSSSDLRDAFNEHLLQTRRHADRLEQIFSLIGKNADTQSNKVVKALTDEGENMIDKIDRSPMRDAALIVAGNQVEHYEMATYGSLMAYAQLLGHNQAASLLEQTLNEEKAADAKMTQIGETSVNRQAMHIGVHAH